MCFIEEIFVLMIFIIFLYDVFYYVGYVFKLYFLSVVVMRSMLIFWNFIDNGEINDIEI